MSAPRLGTLTVALWVRADELAVACSSGIASRLAAAIRPSGFPLRETTKGHIVVGNACNADYCPSSE